MIFKIGNPGCACCYESTAVGACACYSFDNTANNAAADTLHLTSSYPAYSSTEKKLGTHSASFANTAHHSRGHSECFTPAAGPTPWRMWFWIKVVTHPVYTSRPPYAGVITKGNLNYVYGSPPVTSFDGEWGVFYNGAVGSSSDGYWSAPRLLFVYKSSAVALGLFATPFLQVGEWYFFHWQINTTTGAASLFGKSEDGGEVGMNPPTSISGTMSADATHPLRIGNNAGTAGTLLGWGNTVGDIKLDNVGFAQNSGSATSLYNGGTGVACPGST